MLRKPLSLFFTATALACDLHLHSHITGPPPSRASSTTSFQVLSMCQSVHFLFGVYIGLCFL